MSHHSQTDCLHEINKAKTRQTTSIHAADLNKCIHRILHLYWVIPVCMILGIAFGWLFYKLFTVTGWQTDAVLYIHISEDEETGYQMSINEALSYTEVILTQEEVLQSTIENSNLMLTTFQLQNMIEIEKDTASPVLTILVTAETPDLSETISNELLKISLKTISAKCPSLQPSVLESASKESVCQYTPDIMPYLNKGLLAGLFLPFVIGYGIIFIRSTFDTTDEVMEICQLPVVWEANIKDENSITRFCGSYLILHPDVKKLYLLHMNVHSENTTLTKIKACFEPFRETILDGPAKIQKEKGNHNPDGTEGKDPEEKVFHSAEKPSSTQMTGQYQKTSFFSSSSDRLKIFAGNPASEGCLNDMKNCDDVLIILHKRKTKRSYVKKYITCLRKNGIPISSALLIEASKNNLMY